MAKTLEMTFKTDLDKTATYSLSEPKEDLTKTTVETFMNHAIEKNIFQNTAGTLSAIDKMQIREVTITPLA